MEEFFLKKVALKSEVRKMVGSAVFQADFIRVGWSGSKFYSNSQPYMLEYGSGRVYGQLRAGLPGVIQVLVGGRRVPLFLDGYNAETREAAYDSNMKDDLLLYRSAPMVVNLGEHGEAEGRLVLRVEKHAEGYLFLPMDFEPLEPEVATVKMLEDKADRSELSNVMSEDVDGDVEAVEPNLLTDALRKTEQALTAEEKAQVLVNLGRPEMKVFNDMWNAAWGAYGKYDPDNAPDPEHPYMGNDLWMTYEEAVLVVHESRPNELMLAPLNGTFAYRQSRTLLPLRVRILYVDVAPVVTFIGCSNLEVIALDVQGYTGMFRITHFGERAFGGCQKLREVRGIFYMKSATANATSAFENCMALEEIRIKGLKADLSFVWCPRLTLATLEYIVDNAENTSAITITLHPDAYARVTDEIFAAAAEKQISIASI